MVAVNRVGPEEEGGPQFFGHSSVIDPWGETVLEAGEVEGLFTVTVDLGQVARVRREMPALDGMRL